MGWLDLYFELGGFRVAGGEYQSSCPVVLVIYTECRLEGTFAVACNKDWKGCGS